ncbi:MAG: type II secretion system F family protein [Pirellulales bacterium]|nr:type II secretion system F family protein [Pirellulales bacterium]
MSHKPAEKVPISLDQLLFLNDEIVAMIRAGIPLEKGLFALGDDLPGRLGRVSKSLAQSLESGMSLEETLALHDHQFPAVYRAVIRAGVRSGRLPAAFESLADTIRRVRDARRAVASALAYPLMVAAIAWGFFVFYVIYLAPPMAATFADAAPAGRFLLDMTVSLGQTVQYWGPGVPLVILILVIFWWRQSGRDALSQPWWNSIFFGLCPWLGRMIRAARTATFVDILNLLVRNDVPLDEALLLAAESSADARTLSSIQPLAEAITRGEYSPEIIFATREQIIPLPPLLAWIMSAGGPRGTLLSALDHAAKVYHRRARRHAESARLMVPIVLGMFVGGSVTLLWALVVFVPYISILKSIALP